MRKILLIALAVLAVLLATAACTPSHSSHAHQAASQVAASPTVQADEQAAATLVQSCATAAHVAGIKSCIEGKVPLAKRAALRTCLAADAAAVAGRPGAKAKFEQGAQACVATALAP